MKISKRTERWTLALSFLATATTGLGLHMAGHGSDHDVWHNWSVAHIISSIVWLTITIVHVKGHRKWYRLTLTQGMNKKKWVTAILSLIFLLVAVTGIVLLIAVDGANTSLGLWHYKLGLLLIVFSLIHIIGRRKLMCCGLRSGISIS